MLVLLCGVMFEAKEKITKNILLKATIVSVMVGNLIGIANHLFGENAPGGMGEYVTFYLAFIPVTIWGILTIFYQLCFIKDAGKQAWTVGRIVAALLAFHMLISVVSFLTGKFVVMDNGRLTYGKSVMMFGLANILLLLIWGLYIFINRKRFEMHDRIAILIQVIIPVIAYCINLRFVSMATTYFAIAVDILISFMMVQHRELNVNSIELLLQNERLQAFANIYHSMHIIDLKKNTFIECKSNDTIRNLITYDDARKTMIDVIKNTTDADYLERALEFTNLETLPERMQGQDTISAEFKALGPGWYRGRFVAVGRNAEGRLTSVIWATVIVQEEKKKEEGLIKQTITDELTQMKNRHAYQEALEAYDANKEDDVTAISIDVNGLKEVNDNLGHAAGDELLIGAAKCMLNTFKQYGEVYRTGGDEFIALIHIDNEALAMTFRKFEYELAHWKGEKVKEISVSYGAVNRSDYPDASMEELIVHADEKMYDMKRKYYEDRGIDRRRH